MESILFVSVEVKQFGLVLAFVSFALKNDDLHKCGFGSAAAFAGNYADVLVFIKLCSAARGERTKGAKSECECEYECKYLFIFLNLLFFVLHHHYTS